jgi:hypothetical protein
MRTLFLKLTVLALWSAWTCPSLLANDLRDFNELVKGSTMQEVQQAVGRPEKEVPPKRFGSGIEWWYFGIQGYPDSQNRFSVMLLFDESSKKLLAMRLDRE